METLTIIPIDDVWIRIQASDSVYQELSEYFQFEVPGARHMQRVNGGQMRHWDAKIRLFKLRTRTIYRGLVPRVQEFAAARDYEVDNRVPPPVAMWKDLDAELSAMKLPFVPDEHQMLAVRELLDHERGIILSPTGSGKSYIIWLLTRLLSDCKTLIVVPTIGLVTQLQQDFKEYGSDVDAEMHAIFAGQEKNHADKRIYVSTWQSIHKMDASYFEQFDCIMVDEVHHAKAKSLVHLLEKAVKTPFRFGFTGTLEDTECHRLVLEGLFGTISKVTTTNALIKKGRLSPLRVRLCVLEYPDGIRKSLARGNYQDEIEFIVGHGPRQEFLAQLVRQLKGNTLVLFNYIEKQGIPLFDRIKSVCLHKRVHYIAGSVDRDDRESIRQSLSEGNDHVIVASYGTFSTGINVPSLENIVFAHPSKSKYRVLQSIGRTLRTSSGKTHATLIDCVDDLRWKSWQNHAFTHAGERMKFYSAERFPIQMVKVPMTMFAVKHKPTSPTPSGSTNLFGGE